MSKESAKKYRAAHKQEIAEYHRNYLLRNPRSKLGDRKSHLKRKFGLTLEEYDKMWQAQGGVCAICGKVNPNGWALSVDHDHKTGDIRALLCTMCNAGLGNFYDTPELLLKALYYLSNYAKQPS